MHSSINPRHVRTHVSPSPEQYNLVPSKQRRYPAAGKVTVGLASHWPCVTDFSGVSIHGLEASGKETSTPPTLLMGYGAVYLLLHYD